MSDVSSDIARFAEAQHRIASLEIEVQRLESEAAELSSGGVTWWLAMRNVARELGCQSLSDVPSEVRCKLAELADARAVIAKLPVTRDGVPITPKTPLWYRHPIAKGRVYLWERPLFERPATSHFDADGNVHWVGETDCYSTREAAEEAGR